jgi:hypothetical protein
MDPSSLRYSFVVRCWRDDNGLLRGWVVDALTQRSYPFAQARKWNCTLKTWRKTLTKMNPL